MSGTSVPPEHFEAFYRTREDPYDFRASWYEERKRALTLATLRRPAYDSALDLGCGEGILTEALARRCAHLIGVDASPTAIGRATTRLSETGAHVEVAALPRDFPSGRFDLVVVSEVGYFLDREDLSTLIGSIRRALTAGGELVAVHWRARSADYPLWGDAVHAAIDATGWFARRSHYEQDVLLIDSWTAP